MFFRSVAWVIVPLFVMTACSSPLRCPLPETLAPKTERAPAAKGIRFPLDTSLKQRSAFRMLGDPADAYAARLWLVDHARKSLDVQYYIFRDDWIGNDFLGHLVRAADRGVRVRILLDDLTTTAKDTAWSMVTCHPNIELKIFNPNPWRRFFRNVALLLDLQTLGKRMHNKALIADNTAAIVGGRNIGDEYFLPESEVKFIDDDILAVGPIVPEIAEAFALYWESDEARPACAILDGSFSSESFREALRRFDAANEAFENSKTFTRIRQAPFWREAREGTVRFDVAEKAWFYYDLPRKVSSTEDDGSHLNSRIRRDIEGARRSLLLISPYFIPSGPMLERLKEARQRSVTVTVVTNSLASTDVAVVYSGYRRYIEPLLKMGVTLYEVKPMQPGAPGSDRPERRRKRMSLHTKMILIDDDRLVMGSANIDPRSVKLNTEYLLEILSRPLVAQTRQTLDRVLDLDHLYRLAWERYPAWAANGDEEYYGPVWITKEGGKEVRYYRPPGVGFFKRLGIWMFGLLPIEGQL